VKPTILAAVRPQGGVAVRRALGEYANVLPVYTYDDALAALGKTPADLVLCGMFFDETRALDLLRHVRRELPQLPFVACRIGDRAVSPVTVDAMGVAVQSMGAVAFIDMPLLHADPATDTEFRGLVLRHIRKSGTGT
jgi:DNA-binding NtrC family response regulator